jgi:integrase
MLPRFATEALKSHRAGQAERRLTAGSAWKPIELVVDRGDGGPWDPHELSRAFGKLMEAMGRNGIRFHDLRHAYATLMLTLDIHLKVVSESLGHSTIGITLDLYSHVVPTLQSDAARKMNRLLGKTS